MSLPEICIRRPVLASMMSLALVLFGIVGLSRLPVRELPDVDPPIVNVLTVYPGANSEVVETEITEPLEEVINSVEGIKTITSESREQVSAITIEFNLGRDIDLAAQDVRDRVARVRGQLPDEVDEPIVSKQDGDARPFLWIALYSETMTTRELTEFAENTLIDPLQTVSGVSSIIVGGSKRYAMRLWLDSEKMTARGITVLDVERALQRQNLELPSGLVENREREMTIQTLGELKSAEEFNRLIIREDGDNLIRLADIGYAADGVEDERTVARYRSQPAVGLGVIRQSKANTIAVAQGIQEELERLKPLLPQNVETFIAYDESIYVQKAVEEVWVTLGIAFLLVILTIFIFLRNARTTIVPVITIPVALIATFGLLYLLGFSINILTMLALVLAIGVVVDDSIVVLENIYRHIENGMKPMEAALKGMREIVFAVLATTVSLVAVFVPLTLQSSLTGRLFIEFALALAASVVISSFVALTLTPMIAARVLKASRGDSSKGLFGLFERILQAATRTYDKTLRWVIKHRFLVASSTLLAVAAGGWLFLQLDRDFLPAEDKSRLFALVLAPEGATSEYTDRQVRQMEEIIQDFDGVAGYFSAVALARGGPGQASQGLMFVRFEDRANREQSVQDMLAGPTGIGARFFMEIEGAIAFALMPDALGGGFGQPFQLVLQYPDLRLLDQTTQNITNRLRGEGILANLRPNFELNKPEVRLEIDRDRAGALGVTVEDLSRTLQILFGGQDLSQIKRDGKEYDVIVQLDRESRLRPEDILRLYIRNQQGNLVQLSNVLTLEKGSGPNAIYRYNRYRSATIEGTPAGMPLGNVISRVEEILEEELPPGFRYEWAGQTEDLRESGTQIYWVIGLSLLVVYMVLAAQFESISHPLTVMMAVPLAAVGAFGALYLLSQVNNFAEGLYGWVNYGGNAPPWAVMLNDLIPRIPAMNINLFSQIGLVLLIALVTKNGILLVEFANQARNRGASWAEAIREAGLIRLRPILMTSFSTIAGILPIAIGFGAGAEGRRPLGVVAVGGLTTSLFLTLVIIPAFYLILSGRQKDKAKTVAESPSQDDTPPTDPLPQPASGGGGGG